MYVPLRITLKAKHIFECISFLHRITYFSYFSNITIHSRHSTLMHIFAHVHVHMHEQVVCAVPGHYFHHVIISKPANKESHAKNMGMPLLFPDNNIPVSNNAPPLRPIMPLSKNNNFEILVILYIHSYQLSKRCNGFYNAFCWTFVILCYHMFPSANSPFWRCRISIKSIITRDIDMVVF